MSAIVKEHLELTNGVGSCSVPMWCDGLPAGFCNQPAYGKRPECREFWSHTRRDWVREDNRYNGYVPGLACPNHGGPPKPTGKLPDKPVEELTKADLDVAFGPGRCMHRYGKNMLATEDGRFRCPDCSDVFDSPPTKSAGAQ